MADKTKTTLKGTWTVKGADHTTAKTIQECQVQIGGSVRYGMGGKWAKDGDKYLSLNGRLSKNGMPYKLTCKDGDIPISQTDITKLVDAGFVKGMAPVEFE